MSKKTGEVRLRIFYSPMHARHIFLSEKIMHGESFLKNSESSPPSQNLVVLKNVQNAAEGLIVKGVTFTSKIGLRIRELHWITH